MTYVTKLDIHGMTPDEYRSVIWDRKEGFERFLERRLAPTTKALGIDRKTEIRITELHNFFAPRLSELPGIVSSLPGSPGAVVRTG
jgi:hypothetical protein